MQQGAIATGIALRLAKEPDELARFGQAHQRLHAVARYGVARKEPAVAVQAHLPVCRGITVEDHTVETRLVELDRMAPRGQHDAHAPLAQDGYGTARTVGNAAPVGQQRAVDVKEDDLDGRAALTLVSQARAPASR